MFTFPLLLTIYAGFAHAFEADHLLAVSNIVSGRNKLKMSLKDGLYWGLGHASTIFIIGLLMIVFKTTISEKSFNYFEATVGLMLIVLAVYRLIKFFRSTKIVVHVHPHVHTGEAHRHLQVHIDGDEKLQHPHAISYGVGMIHGLAGSGALIVVVMSQMKGPIDGLTYLLIFAVGCIVGMILASGLFSIPFSKKIMQAEPLQTMLIIISSLVCLWFGGKIIYENLLA